MGLHAIIHVSYTHLDVYKRQVMYYPFGYDHYISRLKASQDGNLPALMQAKDAAMVEALSLIHI